MAIGFAILITSLDAPISDRNQTYELIEEKKREEISGEWPYSYAPTTNPLMPMIRDVLPTIHDEF